MFISVCTPHPTHPTPHPRVAERLEWWTFYLLAADDNGIISKEKVRKQYDGSLWYEIESELQKKKNARASSKAKWT
jgi:hypothetical protein